MATTFRSGHEGFFAFGVEGTNLLPDAQQWFGLSGLGATPLPVMAFAGFSSAPQFTTNENTSIQRGIGSYRGYRFYKGRREHAVSCQLTLGNPSLLAYALRSGAFTSPTIGGLKPLSVAGGAVNTHDAISQFSWIGRHALINTVKFSVAEGQVFTADVEFWPLALVRNGPLFGRPTVESLETALLTAGRSVFTWHACEVTINGVSRRDIVRKVGINVSNSLERVGQRPDFGDDEPLSRCALQNYPLQEEVQFEFELSDKLPDNLVSSVTDATLWDRVVLTMTAPYTDSNGGSHQHWIYLTLGKAALNQYTMAQSGPQDVMKFSSSGPGLGVTLTYQSQ